MTGLISLVVTSLVVLGRVDAQSLSWTAQARALVDQLDADNPVLRKKTRADLLLLAKGREAALAHFLSRELDRITASRPHAGKTLIILMAELGDRLPAEARVNSYWQDYGARAQAFQMAIRIAYRASISGFFQSPTYESSHLILDTALHNLSRNWSASSILTASPYERDRDVAVAMMLGLLRSDTGAALLTHQPSLFWQRIRQILQEAEYVEEDQTGARYSLTRAMLQPMNTPAATTRLLKSLFDVSSAARIRPPMLFSVLLIDVSKFPGKENFVESINLAIREIKSRCKKLSVSQIAEAMPGDRKNNLQKIKINLELRASINRIVTEAKQEGYPRAEPKPRAIEISPFIDRPAGLNGSMKFATLGEKLEWLSNASMAELRSVFGPGSSALVLLSRFKDFLQRPRPKTMSPALTFLEFLKEEQQGNRDWSMTGLSLQVDRIYRVMGFNRSTLLTETDPVRAALLRAQS